MVNSDSRSLHLISKGSCRGALISALTVFFSYAFSQYFEDCSYRDHGTIRFNLLFAADSFFNQSSTLVAISLRQLLRAFIGTSERNPWQWRQCRKCEVLWAEKEQEREKNARSAPKFRSRIYPPVNVSIVRVYCIRPLKKSSKGGGAAVF